VYALTSAMKKKLADAEKSVADLNLQLQQQEDDHQQELNVQMDTAHEMIEAERGLYVI
jgi:hypothetical protein